MNLNDKDSVRNRLTQGIDDPIAKEFLEKLIDAPEQEGETYTTTLYHLYFGDPSALPPMMRQKRIEFFNSRKRREEELELMGLPIDSSFEKIAQHLKQSAKDAGWI